jgi:hypothetical protein
VVEGLQKVKEGMTVVVTNFTTEPVLQTSSVPSKQ